MINTHRTAAHAQPDPSLGLLNTSSLPNQPQNQTPHTNTKNGGKQHHINGTNNSKQKQNRFKQH